MATDTIRTLLAHTFPGSDIAVDDVNRKTLRRRLDALELADAERARRTATKRAEEKADEAPPRPRLPQPRPRA